MVFDGCYQPNLDDNRGAVAWGIHCTYIQIDTHGGIFPQHHKWKMHTYQSLQAYMKYYQLWNLCVNYII